MKVKDIPAGLRQPSHLELLGAPPAFDTAESSFLAVLHPYHFFPQTFYIVVVARLCGSRLTQEKNSFSLPIFHFDIGERR